MAGIVPGSDNEINEKERVHEVVTAAIAACHGVEEITEERHGPKSFTSSTISPRSSSKSQSLFDYLYTELRRGYVLENDEAHYTERREKIYTFMKIPRDVEKFMAYGFLQCIDVLLFLFTYLPLRFLLSVWFLFYKTLKLLFGCSGPVLQPAEICDFLKGLIMISGIFMMSYFDTSVLYHLVKSQSVIKLYLIFNMLEVADRLFSSFGQDTLDALYWTATEPRGRRREHLGVLPHLTLAIFYILCHTTLILLQATTLNVAINSQNKALLTIMMSNNFVELKGSVFKKFEKNNLFQITCSDVRERIHYVILLLIVIVQTMKEYSWKEERLLILLPDCAMVLICEFLVDWVKHAFITRFNEIPSEVYRDYTVSLAYDLAATKQKNAFSHHSDLVSRRMGFTPFPLAILIYKVFSQAISLQGIAAKVIFAIGFLCLFTLKIMTSIIIFGKACDFIEQHQKQKGEMNDFKAAQEGRCKSHPVSRKTSKDNLLQKTKAKSMPHTPSPSNSTSLLDISNTSKSLDQGPIFSNSTVSLNSVCLNDAVLEKSTSGAESQPQQPVKDSCMSRGRANSTSGIRHRVSLVERPLFYIADDNVT